MFRKRNYILKTAQEIEGIKVAGKMIYEIFEKLEDYLQPGMRTAEIDKYIDNLITEQGAYPAFKTVPGYKHASCISINEEVVHGIPSYKKKIREGDIVKIDIGTVYNKYIGDSCRTFAIGKITNKAKKLMEVTEKALYLGIEQARIGNRLGDIGYAIQTYVEANGFNVVRDYTGHGVGIELHEEPQVLHYGKPNTGLPLVEGMVLAIEPMVNIGTYKVKTKKDKWTVVSLDGKLSAQYEHSVAITKDGPVITTK